MEVYDDANFLRHPQHEIILWIVDWILQKNTVNMNKCFDLNWYKLTFRIP